MISRELIEKINRLWHKQQSVGLSKEEKEDQRLAREEYLAAIRSQVRGMLEAIKNPVDDETQDHTHHCQCNKCRH